MLNGLLTTPTNLQSSSTTLSLEKMALKNLVGMLIIIGLIDNSSLEQRNLNKSYTLYVR